MELKDLALEMSKIFMGKNSKHKQSVQFVVGRERLWPKYAIIAKDQSLSRKKTSSRFPLKKVYQTATLSPFETLDNKPF